MNEQRTTDSLIEAFDKRVREKISTSPSEWVEAAGYLNALIGEEHDKLYDLEQNVAKLKAAYIIDGDSVAAASVKVEAEDLYREYRIQKAKISQIEEFIRISKIQAKLRDTEMRNY